MAKTRLEMVEEIVITAQKALAGMDEVMKKERAIPLERKTFLSHAGVLDSIILLGEEIIKNKKSEMEEI